MPSCWHSPAAATGHSELEMSGFCPSLYTPTASAHHKLQSASCAFLALATRTGKSERDFPVVWAASHRTLGSCQQGPVPVTSIPLHAGPKGTQGAGPSLSFNCLILFFTGLVSIFHQEKSCSFGPKYDFFCLSQGKVLSLYC